MYTIEPTTPQTTNTWDTVIRRCPNTTAFQSTAWRNALDDTFKQLQPVYLLLKQHEAVIGAVPAFIFEPIPGIRLWHSMPWNLFGGPQIEESAHVNTTDLLSTIETYLQTTSKQKSWSELCLTLSPTNTTKYDDYLTTHGWTRHERFTHLLQTDTDINTLWAAYNKRVRGAVRKAEKSGVQVINTDDKEDLSTFYEMYLSTLKRLGGTPKPRSLMEKLLDSGISKLAIAKYRDKIIAGLLYLYYNHTVTLWCEASLPEYLQYRPNNAIFHHIITWACAEGYKTVDFGASPPESKGLIAHKEQYRAKRANFCTYTKTVSPLKKALWTHTEGTLRKIYTWLQQPKSYSVV